MIEANWQYIILCIVSPSKEEQTVNKQHDCGWVTEGTGGLSPLPSTGGHQLITGLLPGSFIILRLDTGIKITRTHITLVYIPSTLNLCNDRK